MRKKILVIGAIAGSAMLVGGWALAASGRQGTDHGAMQHKGQGKLTHKGHDMGRHRSHETAIGRKSDAPVKTGTPAASSPEHKH
jgi:hypothetical protein